VLALYGTILGRVLYTPKPNQSIGNLVGRDMMRMFFAALVSSLLSALVSFGGMSHDLRNNSLQKPIGEQYDRPKKTRGLDPNPPLSAVGNQFSMIRNSIGAKLSKFEPSADKLLAPGCAARSVKQSNATPTNRTVIRSSNYAVRFMQRAAGTGIKKWLDGDVDPTSSNHPPHLQQQRERLPIKSV
jgi:hypothetical protein